jgi:hypothetical protein
VTGPRHPYSLKERRNYVLKDMSNEELLSFVSQYYHKICACPLCGLSGRVVLRRQLKNPYLWAVALRYGRNKLRCFLGYISIKPDYEEFVKTNEDAYVYSQIMSGAKQIVLPMGLRRLDRYAKLLKGRLSVDCNVLDSIVREAPLIEREQSMKHRVGELVAAGIPYGSRKRGPKNRGVSATY